MTRKKHDRVSAQALVEYAIIIVLVAIVVVAAAAAVGLGLQRNYRLNNGSLGGSGSSSVTTQTIDIPPGAAQCIAVHPQPTANPPLPGKVGLWVNGTTSEPANVPLTGLSTLGQTIVDRDGANFTYHPLIDGNHDDLSECPSSIVIQAPDGTIAVAQITKFGS